MGTTDYDIKLVERLGEINRRLAAIHDLDSLCEEVQHIIASILDVEYSALYQYDPETQ